MVRAFRHALLFLRSQTESFCAGDGRIITVFDGWLENVPAHISFGGGISFMKKCNKHQNGKKIAWLSVLFAVMAVLFYIIVYSCFLGDGFLSPGKELEKRDWLGFFGAYLSFIGTVAVSLIAILQSSYFNKRENERRYNERLEMIQPIFSVSISEQNSHVGNYAVSFNLNDASTYPKYDNFTIKIENIGEYPAMHICIFEKYMFPAIKPEESKSIQAAFSDSEDVRKYPKGLRAVLDSSEPKDEKQRLPLEFNICYDDIDGNSLYQTFRLMDYEGVKHYALKYKEVVSMARGNGCG